MTTTASAIKEVRRAAERQRRPDPRFTEAERDAAKQRDRHTGTQTAATISDFAAASRQQAELLLVPGTGLTITPSGSGSGRTLTLDAAVGPSIVKGSATIALPHPGVREHVQSVAATGILPGHLVSIGLAPAADSAENAPEMLDLIALAATPGTGTITITATFMEPTSGPILLQWSAV